MDKSKKLKPKQVYVVASGDLRLSANRVCWPEQTKMESALSTAIKAEGWTPLRAHPYDSKKKHGFIDSQKMGLEVFKNIDPEAPLIVAESVWQYSHHVWPGLSTHRGPILTVANWSGTWPGLVGMLNLNGTLTKAGVNYSTLWSETFKDKFFKDGLRQWLRDGRVIHDQSHVRNAELLKLPDADEQAGREFAQWFKHEKPILGVFDEGCMGMYNAIIPDHLLAGAGVFKERLSQSALYAATMDVPDSDARKVYHWLKRKGIKFNFGSDEETELTEDQVLTQCKMYIAATRIADDFGCGIIGIQYQQGLKDLLPASDLAEGMLNNVDRPPVKCPETGRELFKGEAVTHFNEVDECAGLDALVTYRLWRKLKFPPETTLHDVRWGEYYKGSGVDDFVWLFEISGAVPPAHLVGGYKGAVSERQPPMYFRLGGGTIKGVSKPGWIVWSRVFVMDDKLHCDIGVGKVVALSEKENGRRWNETTPQWPVMHTVLPGITRDQMVGRHKANHIQVAYAPNEKQAHRAARIKAAAMSGLGIDTYLCGDIKLS
ncbi:MAG: fucose isomerase [Verrucomicrobia bacterium]|nr:fucose isomerase [Verrucomicrobiota bacterium]